MKKVFKIIGITLLVLVIFLLTAPFLFKGTIEKQVKKAINNNLHAQVEWSDLSLSLIRSFPDAQLRLKNISVINKEPFEGDTLVAAKMIYLNMGIPQLFKGGDKPLSINELGLKEALVNIKVNKDGIANYDVAIDADTSEEEIKEDEKGMTLDVQHYEINNSRIAYADETSRIYLMLNDFNHEGTGDFSADVSTLRTKTKTLLSFKMEESQYFENTALSLDAAIKMDLQNMRFSFEENRALINQLALSFDGYLQMNEDNQEIDLTFTTPTSDFKNFLGVVPKEYMTQLDQVKTSGKFEVDGRLFGIIDEQHIPKMDISMKASDAYFKFPDLPKAVDNINFAATLKNETGLMKDMNLDLSQMNFQIDQDIFSGKGSFKDLTGNTDVQLSAKGRLNLANINKAYPLEMDMDLNGILDADLNASFKMDDIEKERYENIKSSGSASLRDFKYTSEDFAHPVEITKAALQFNPMNVNLQEFDMKMGQTDAQITGSIQNLMGYVFKDQPIKGDFKVKSQTFSVNDFMVAEDASAQSDQKTEQKQAADPSSEEAIKIPAFLDATLGFTANRVLYDNLTLANAKGSLRIKDEKATLQNISADIFGGSIALNGSVSTKTETPKFDMKLNLNKIGIVQSVREMELLHALAPITQALVGDLTTEINLSGDLTKDFSPIYSSLSGAGLAEILNAHIEKGQLDFVSKLNSELNFVDVDKLNLKNITTKFSFKDGGVDFDPFHFNLHKDIQAELKGRHTFDNELNYVMDLDIPAKYLGKELSSQFAKLSGQDIENMKVDVPVTFTGSLKNPKINMDLKSATKALTDGIIDQQKKDLEDKAKDKAKDLIDGFLGKDDKEGEKSKEEGDKKSREEELKDKAKDALDGIFGKKKK